MDATSTAALFDTATTAIGDTIMAGAPGVLMIFAALTGGYVLYRLIRRFVGGKI
jgi:hypothetical protein